MFFRVLIAGLAAWGLGWQRIKKIFKWTLILIPILAFLGFILSLFGYR